MERGEKGREGRGGGGGDGRTLAPTNNRVEAALSVHGYTRVVLVKDGAVRALNSVITRRLAVRRLRV